MPLCLNPFLFQVNMVDWTFYSRYFYTILVNWMGSKAAVLESAKRTSCGVTAMELLQREIREECLQASTGIGYKVVPRLRELAPRDKRESGGGILAT